MLDSLDSTKLTQAHRDLANKLLEYDDETFKKAVQNGLIGPASLERQPANPDDAFTASPEEIKQLFADRKREAYWTAQFDDYFKDDQQFADGRTRDDALIVWHSLRLLSTAVGAFAVYKDWSRVGLLLDLDENTIPDAAEFSQ